ncbi:MAG TPA: exopolysaccharide biosynthesis protein [Clostridiales bacterium]|nr:MAG: hypothetical protein A2Y22_00650 [Clostridiales bacterium GWD2_32_59]HAN10268.1 exopolysaccharide biosynthesis protein [Clostridiales bacterium]
MKSKIHKSALYILGFIAFEAVFCSILAFILILYGPFNNIKENYVTTAMATLNHQYLATTFLSKEEINEILLKSSFDFESEREDINGVKIKEGQTSDEIKLVEVSSERFKGHILIVDNPKRIKVGLSSTLGKGGITLSSIVKNYEALGGVNAGGFGDANLVGTGGKPNGIVVEDGEIKYKEEGMSSFSIVGFDKDDKLIVGGNYNEADMKKYNIRDAVSFGPALIINGKTMIKKGNGGMGINPRTAIGQTQDGKVLLLVIDGRREDSLGATLKDVQNILLKYGAYNASNLDGGSSTTMVYDNKLINKPSDILGERSIPSAFIIK